MNSISEEDGDKLLDAFSSEERQQFESLVSEAMVDSQRTALLVIAGLVGVALAVGTFLPGRHRREEKVEPGSKAALK